MKTYDVKAIYPTFKIWTPQLGVRTPALCVYFDEDNGEAVFRFPNSKGLVVKRYSSWGTWAPPPVELPAEMPPFFVYKWLTQRVGPDSFNQLNPRVARINPMKLSNGYSTSLPGDMFIVVFTDQRPARWMTRAQLIDLIDDETEDDD